MDVKPGYKQTEVGVVPNDWDVPSIDQVFQFKQGVQSPIEQQSTVEREGYLRFIRIVDLTNPQEDWRFIEDPGISHHVIKTDLFMVRYGSPGLMGFGYEGVIANNLFRLLPKKKVDRHFYYQYLANKQDEIAALSGSSTMPAVTFSTLRLLFVVYPPVSEQSAIAEVLGDVDALIGLLDRLIAKKRDFKHAAMQQLLTGQIRLPGFSTKWKRTKVRDLCEIEDGEVTPEGALNYLEIGDVDVVGKTYDISQKEKLSVRGAVKVPRGTLLISTVRPTRGAITITREAIHVSSAFCRLRTTNHFVFHVSTDSKFLTHLGENSIGGTYPTCREATILDYSCLAPTDDAEQTAIAAVLSDMDAELAALEQRRDKTRALKQGMMQELLTGRIRLV